MTKEMKEITKRISRAKASEGGAVVLITTDSVSDEVRTIFDGRLDNITLGIFSAIKALLEELPYDEARTVREGIKNILIEDEERRFQEVEK